MVDDILYTEKLVLDVSVSNNGTADKIVFEGKSGEMMQINQVHEGPITDILYQKQLMEYVVLKSGEIIYAY